MIVFAHAGHWLVQAAYLAPLLVLVGILVVNQLRERRERARDGGAQAAAPATGGGPGGRPERPPE